jgi:hypothetical protein
MPIISTIWEAKIERMAVQCQPGQKGGKALISTNKLGVMVNICNSQIHKDLGRRIEV